MSPLNVGPILILCCIALVHTRNVPIQGNADETAPTALLGPGCPQAPCHNLPLVNENEKNNAKDASNAATLTSAKEDTVSDNSKVRVKYDDDCRSNRAQCPLPPVL